MLNLHTYDLLFYVLMFFSSIKEINRLISRRMSNIYLKVTIQKNWRSQNFDFLKKIISRSVFGEFQFKQIPLNSKTSCYNLKIRN